MSSNHYPWASSYLLEGTNGRASDGIAATGLSLFCSSRCSTDGELSVDIYLVAVTPNALGSYPRHLKPGKPLGTAGADGICG